MLKTLVERHQTLFQGRIPPCSKLDEGWYPLVDALCSQLENSLSADEMRAFHIRQITSEVGTLRILRGGIRQLHVERLVDAVERLSAWLCVDCGSPGRLRKGKEPATLCDFCEMERQIRATRCDRSRSTG